MAASGEEKINQAVRACLDRCYSADAPLKAIIEFINELDADSSWSEAEIDQVEGAVLRMLVKIARRSPELGSVPPPPDLPRG